MFLNVYSNVYLNVELTRRSKFCSNSYGSLHLGHTDRQGLEYLCHKRDDNCGHVGRFRLMDCSENWFSAKQKISKFSCLTFGYKEGKGGLESARVEQIRKSAGTYV